MRALVFGIIYGVGFGAGIALNFAILGSAPPTYALLGQHWGDAGIRATAFIPFAFALLGALIRLWGAAHISTDVVWSSVVTSAGLRLRGPYLYVRNPLYLGNLFLAIGIGCIGPPISTLLIVIGNLIFILRLIRIEERYLRASYGQAYLDYCALVPRLVPRLTPAAPSVADPRRPAWADGVVGEIYFFSFVAFALYTAIFAWKQPDARILGLIFVIAIGAQMIARQVLSRKPVTP